MTKTQIISFNRTYKNCKFYINEIKDSETENYLILKLLINEYGCLRGILYTLNTRDYQKCTEKFNEIHNIVEPIINRDKYWEQERIKHEKTRND